jgi:catechol 2,3-dioxygenase-like lactoylglutathione lyase family enzyme
MPSADVQRAVEFYEALGLILIVDSVPRYARFACPDGEATFSIHQVEVLAPGEKPVVYFECDDLDATVARLENLGISFELKPVDQPWLWREAYLRDPDGNQICLYYAGENRLNPPWKIKL